MHEEVWGGWKKKHPIFYLMVQGWGPNVFHLRVNRVAPKSRSLNPKKKPQIELHSLKSRRLCLRRARLSFSSPSVAPLLFSLLAFGTVAPLFKIARTTCQSSRRRARRCPSLFFCCRGSAPPLSVIFNFLIVLSRAPLFYFNCFNYFLISVAELFLSFVSVFDIDPGVTIFNSILFLFLFQEF